MCVRRRECVCVCDGGGGVAHFSISPRTSAKEGGDMSFLTSPSVAAHVFIHCVSS